MGQGFGRPKWRAFNPAVTVCVYVSMYTHTHTHTHHIHVIARFSKGKLQAKFNDTLIFFFTNFLQKFFQVCNIQH